MVESRRIRKQELFCWCVSSYVSEIHSYLKNQELQIGKFHFRSPQMKYRARLIAWIKKTSLTMKLSTLSVHLGIHLLDTFMDRHHCKENRMHALGLACLLIAAKYEEECSRPSMKDLPSYVEYELSVGYFAYLEVLVFKSFNWHIGFTTAAHFAEYYSFFAVVAGDKDVSKTQHRHLQDIVQSSIRDYLDVSLTEIKMRRFLYSKVAATCLLAARQEHNIIPLWPKIITKITGYTKSSLSQCLDILLEANENYKSFGFEDSRSESGYESNSPDNIVKKMKVDI